MSTKTNQEPNHKNQSGGGDAGTNPPLHRHRLLKEDGSFNVVVEGLPWFRPSEIYQNLIQMSWLKFNLIVLTAYVVMNTLFAFIYFLIGTENLTNAMIDTPWHRFEDAFFFSSQSITTVGYGRMAPVGVPTGTVAALESLVGLLGFALATGLLYGRFSRPNARLIHSRNFIISPYKNGAALMFRIANSRMSQLVSVDVKVTYKRNAMENDKEIRQFIPLHLENPHMNMFPLTWTVTHVINLESPLWGKTLADFEQEDLELLVYFSGYDETFSNNVHARVSYKSSEAIWGAKFLPNFVEVPGQPTVHHVSKISEYESVPLPVPDTVSS